MTSLGWESDRRVIRTTRAWLRKAVAHASREPGDRREDGILAALGLDPAYLILHENDALLVDLVDGAVIMADRGNLNTPDEFLFWEHLLEKAEALIVLLRARQADEALLALIAKLEDTTGRTPAEAAAFRAKATALRARLGAKNFSP